MYGSLYDAHGEVLLDLVRERQKELRDCAERQRWIRSVRRAREHGPTARRSLVWPLRWVLSRG